MEKVMTDQEFYTSLICILIFILFILSGFVIWYLLSKNEFKNDEIDLEDEEQETLDLGKLIQLEKEICKSTDRFIKFIYDYFILDIAGIIYIIDLKKKQYFQINSNIILEKIPRYIIITGNYGLFSDCKLILRKLIDNKINYKISFYFECYFLQFKLLNVKTNKYTELTVQSDMNLNKLESEILNELEE